MFHRLHIQMTFFSALIIGIVTFIMTTACNFIAENSTGQNDNGTDGGSEEKTPVEGGTGAEAGKK